MRLCCLQIALILATIIATPLAAQDVDQMAMVADDAGVEQRALDSAVQLDQEALKLAENGKLEQARARFETALQLRSKALGRRHVDTISSVETYGLVLEMLGRYAEAEPYFTEAVTLSVEVLGNRHPLTLTRLSGAAGILEKLGRDIEAEELHAIALRLRAEVLGASHPDALESLEQHALVIARLGRISEAERSLRRVVDARLGANGAKHPASLKAQHNYASIIRRLGRLEESESILRAVLEARRDALGPSHGSTINTLSSLGVVLAAAGKPDQAERFLQDALRLNREVRGDRHPETLLSLSNYAGILAKLERLPEAEALYDDALMSSIETLGYDHPRTVMVMAELADIARRLGRLEKAEEFLKAAIGEVGNRLGREHPSTLRLANNYAQVLVDLDRLESAQVLQAEVVDLARQKLGDTHPDALSYARNHARILVSIGQEDAALSILASVLEERRRVLGDRHPDTLASMGENARIAFAAGRIEEALSLSREWVAGIRERRQSLAQTGFKGAGQVGRTAGVRRRAESLLADALRAQLSTTDADAKTLGQQAFEALQLASSGAASKAVAEAAAARFAIDRGMGARVSQRQALVREWPALEAALVENQVGGESAAAERARLRARMVAIESQLTEIDAELQTTAPEFFAILSQNAVKLENIRDVIGPEEAMLMLVPTAIGTHMMVASHDAAPWSWSSLDAQAIAAKVDELREGLEVTGGGGLPVFDFELAHELYAELIAPVESALVGKKRVYVVADGALSRLPLGVLLTEKLDAADVANGAGEGDGEGAGEITGDPVRGTMLGGAPSSTASAANDPEDFARAQWLADRYALVNLPSLQSLVFIRTFGLSDEDIEGAGYTGFGDPVLARHASQNGSRSAGLGGSVDASTMLSRSASGDALMNPASLKQMASLPGTKRELEQVSQLLGASDTSLFLGAAMTEPAIRSADLSKTRILHLATHGLTSEEGGRLGDLAEPGLVFTPPEQSSEANDGYLAASEVVGLNLSLADWVILSACNTAAPSGKAGETGLSGLAQAFFYAGAESLLVSHWPVFDSVAPILTAETLARAQQGTPRAEAFQQAMQQVRTTNPHPAAWAPFVLVGEGL